MFNRRVAVFALCLFTAFSVCEAQTKKKNKKNKKPATKLKDIAPGGELSPMASLNRKGQQDFPAMCIAPNGLPLIAYIDHDGKADILRVAKLKDGAFGADRQVSEPGDVYQPCLARDGNDTVWCVWSQAVAGEWKLSVRSITRGAMGKTFPATQMDGNNLFPDAKTDSKGRVWVTWQNHNGGHPDVYTRYYDPKTKTWSKVIQVTKHKLGDWEPRLAFGANDEALIVFDSYRNGNFDVMLARVGLNGSVKISPIATTDRYEARAEAAGSGDTLWVAYENGTKRWGKDLGSEWRKRGGGLHYDRHLFMAKVDLKTGKVSTVDDVTNLIPGLSGSMTTPGSSAIDVPELAVDGAGNPWLFFRYSIYGSMPHWKLAVTKYDVASASWAKARSFEKSNYCLDRRTAVSVDPKGQIYAAWASDLRTRKNQGSSGVYLAKIDPTRPVEAAGPLAKAPTQPDYDPVNSTPERDRNERHAWKHGDTEYKLYWGDFHRHTDFSNCRTQDDGCIKEHYRYAYEATGLDYLGTSDHTDAGKTYHPYEWWQTQKYVDMFHNPGYFLGFYVYEREQRWPYGHRNIVFRDRGGPIIYINRKRYEDSLYAKDLPAPTDGDNARKGEISPHQLWKMLNKYGKTVRTIEHTSAGGMGTNWEIYKQIDERLETLLEVYQGSRESYEGIGAPQPRVATSSSSNFGQFSKGVYQNALKQGYKLGAFASSDHRSTNISYGGVYVKDFSRDGVFEAMDARRTVAATDKIFMEFTCNGRMLGEVFETSKKPTLSVSIKGTASIQRVTIIRNETNYKVFSPGTSKDFDATFTDENPVAGENRYYVRVEQADGNMGWTSPVWVTFKP